MGRSVDAATVPTVDEERARMLAFERDLLRRTTTRAEPFRWGTAYLDERFPLRWDSNLLWAEGSLEGASADDLAGDADRILGGAGLSHRNILVEDLAASERLASRLVALGYRWDRLLTMVHRRQADRPPRAPVEEVDVETFVSIVAEATRPEPYAVSEEVVEQIAGHRRVLAEAGARFFVAFEGGVPASRCELYVGEGIAQVEDVGTLEPHRGRGLARAVVVRAIEEARAEGCDLVYLHADDEDWPKELYGRLGFEPFARWSAFDRHGVA
jgi:GNAT superfamily N-acetyltransferase